MHKKNNALTELAERLDQVGVELCNDFLDADSKDAIRKAQRIVSVLASRYEPCFPVKSGDDVIDECRAIALEGVSNGK